MPMEYRKRRQVPLFYFLEEDLREPASPATPSRRKTMEEMYNPMSEPVTVACPAELMMDFFSTCT